MYKTSDKSECGNYRGISLVFVGSKILIMMILIKLGDLAHKVVLHQILTLQRELEV